MKPSGGLLDSLKRQLKRFMSHFADKPTARVEEYVLEHLLLYHGLVGSSPENQRKFLEVRADIAAAVEHHSSRELCIALKLPPLWWEDKLQTIIREVAADNPEAVLRILLPEQLEPEATAQADPLQHEDW